MSHLILSILFSTSLILIFKAFQQKQVNTFHAIVINYFIASTLGYAIGWQDVDISSIPEKPWFPVSILVGFMFIVMFYFIAITAQKIGVSQLQFQIKCQSLYRSLLLSSYMETPCLF